MEMLSDSGPVASQHGAGRLQLNITIRSTFQANSQFRRPMGIGLRPRSR